MFLRPNQDLLRKNATLGHTAKSRTSDLANLVRCSANWATEAVAASMANEFRIYNGGNAD